MFYIPGISFSPDSSAKRGQFSSLAVSEPESLIFSKVFKLKFI